MPIVGPTKDWSLKQLSKYAVANLGEARVMTRNTAVKTYRAGCALFFARGKLIGMWEKWLKKHDIPRVSAWEAIRLYEECPSEKDLEGLSITEAKVKFGIYQETPKSEDPVPERSSGSGGISGSSGGYAVTSESLAGKSPEQVLSLLYHRVKGALEIAKGFDWTPETIHSVEVKDTIKMCKSIRTMLLLKQSRIKAPKRDRKAVNAALAKLETI